MNVFTNLLFLQGHLADPHLFDDEDDRYAKGYGNRIASERFFAPLGHHKTVRTRDADAPQGLDLALDGCR
ncbi:hypothetical protein [Lysobacter panacisoli]|uniref:Uncharacterized protein n=1 Tax=Lysobacter panacisoli TaxID=1255263 RepID=A0ABP9L049_9GAMM|nr:hypothetical protein [Lysobacter panacisoli]